MTYIYWTFVVIQFLYGIAYAITQEERILIASWITTMLFIAWIEKG